jgi:general secretion pathway protein A
VYLSFYSLRKEPFQITPDPEFLYLSPSHKEALGAILYGVMQRKGFIAIIGEVGVGKTTILRSYIEEADKKHLRIVYVFDANVSFIGLLRTIHRELGLMPAGGKDGKDEPKEPFDLVSRIQEFLIAEYQKGGNLVVIIDEAQNMPIETLESLRMLSNLETSTDKLIQIVLIGPPELEERLNLKELRQLKQRIAVKATISPLTSEECAAYIQHRLTKAGADHLPIFTKGALKKIIRQSHGIPRTINILCDNALITGFGYQKRRIGAHIIREVIADFRQSRIPFRMRWRLARLAFLVILLLAAVMLWIWTFPYGGPLLPGFKVGSPLKSPPHPPALSSVEGPLVSPVERPVLSSVEGPAGETFPQVRVVKKGDTLSDLIRDIYGSSNRELMEQVKLSNPRITDINWIVVGDQVVFPKPKEARARAEVSPKVPPSRSPGKERRLLAGNGR